MCVVLVQFVQADTLVASTYQLLMNASIILILRGFALEIIYSKYVEVD